MAKDRNERYQTASEMALELARIAASVVETPSPTAVDEVNLVQSDAVIPTAPPPSPIPVPIPAPQSVAREPIHQPTPAPPAEEVVSVPVLQSTPHLPAQVAADQPVRLPSTTPPPVISRSISHKPLSKPLVSIVVVGVIGLLCLVVFGVFSLRGARFMKNFLNFRASVLKSTPTQSIDSAVIAAPTVEDIPLPTLGAILFQDDFNDPISGWESYRGSDGIRDYENGAYRILVDIPDQYFFSIPGKNFTDVNITVDATKVAGPDDNYFGIICRFQDLNNFYFFIISSDGFYAIGKNVVGEVSILGQDTMLYSQTIHRGETDNSVQAKCAGDQLGLYVNNIELVSIQDTTFSSGDVGLLVGTFKTYGANMVFDNFIVARP
jgi:hypothetical protein